MGNKDSMDLLFILCSCCYSPQLFGLDINILKSLDATERQGGLQLDRVLQGLHFCQVSSQRQWKHRTVSVSGLSVG